MNKMTIQGRLRAHPVLILALFCLVMPYLLRLMGATYLLATEILIFMIFALGFNILMGFTGITSFGHGAFFGLAAYTTVLVQLHLIKSMVVPIVSGILVTTLAGAVVGAFIIRKRGIYFALLTLAFGQLLFTIVFRWTSLTGGENGLGGITRLPIMVGPVHLDLKNELVFYYVVYAITIICAYLIWRILRSSFGKILLAIRENETRALCLGYGTRMYKLAAFTLSCFFTGIAGSLYVFLLNFIFPETLHWMSSGNVVLMSLVGGMHNFFGPIWGAFSFIYFRDLFSSLTIHWMFFFGAIFIVFLMFSPDGICGILNRLGLRFFGEASGKESVDLSLIFRPNPEGLTLTKPLNPSSHADGVVLAISELTKSFGALIAVNSVSLEVKRGEIQSIIGPNGAGKTTFFNCITGMLEADKGRIIFNNQEITGAPANKVARLGIARSFQIVSLFQEITVFENIRIAALAKVSHRRNFLTHANAFGDIQKKTMDIIQQVGLQGKENIVASELPHGNQRLLEIGITLAGDPEILLLDEPFAGLSSSEKDQVVDLVRKLVPRYTIILIDHDIDKVLALSDRITVMHLGKVIADGKPAEIQQNEEVKQAYLGIKGEIEKEVGARTPTPEAATKPKAQLILKEVNSFYGKSHILHDISMEVEEGEVVSLLGRNGAGKTTTLRSIMGVTPPRRGVITYRGESLVGLAPNVIAQKGIGIVPQDRRVFQNLAVIDNLRIATRAKEGFQWDFDRIFQHFPRLRDLRYSRGENLSGGEQQMLAIARTIMGNVDLLLLDEPFEGLAPLIIMEIRNIIDNIRAGMTVIIVEQNAEVALGLSNRTYVLENGRVVHHGDARELLRDKELRAKYLAV